MQRKKIFFTGSMNLYARTLAECLSAPGNDACETSDMFAGRLAEAFRNDKKGKILSAAVCEETEQEKLRETLSGIDIETLPGDDALLMAIARQRHGETDPGGVNEPRLQGLLRYHRFSSLGRLSFFSETVGVLNRAGVVPTASYDVAMKYYMPESVRLLDGAGIDAVSDEEYDGMLNVLKEAGFAAETDGVFCEVSEKDKQGQKLKIRNASAAAGNDCRPEIRPDSFEAAELFQVRCRVPSREDLAVTAAERIFEDLRGGANFRGVGSDVRDLVSLIRECGVSSDELCARFSDGKILSGRYRFIRTFVNAMIPGLLPAAPGGPEPGAAENFLDAEWGYVEYVYGPKHSALHDAIVKTGLPAKMPHLVAVWHRLRGRQ